LRQMPRRRKRQWLPGEFESCQYPWQLGGGGSSRMKNDPQEQSPVRAAASGCDTRNYTTACAIPGGGRFAWLPDSTTVGRGAGPSCLPGGRQILQQPASPVDRLKRDARSDNCRGVCAPRRPGGPSGHCWRRKAPALIRQLRAPAHSVRDRSWLSASRRDAS
jgi:hypothetical protein